MSGQPGKLRRGLMPNPSPKPAPVPPQRRRGDSPVQDQRPAPIAAPGGNGEARDVPVADPAPPTTWPAKPRCSPTPEERAKLRAERAEIQAEREALLDLAGPAAQVTWADGWAGSGAARGRSGRIPAGSCGRTSSGFAAVHRTPLAAPGPRTRCCGTTTDRIGLVNSVHEIGGFDWRSPLGSIVHRHRHQLAQDLATPEAPRRCSRRRRFLA